MYFRVALNRLLYTVVPGLGQILNGQYVTGLLVAAAAVGTLYLAENANDQYRLLQSEYKKLNLPAKMHNAIALDRYKSLATLAGVYLGLGVLSAAFYTDHDDPPEDHYPDSEEI